MYRIRIGCRLEYMASGSTPAVFIVEPPPHGRQILTAESLTVEGAALAEEFSDHFGNRCQRATLHAGASVIKYEAVAMVPRDADPARAGARQTPPQELPSRVLRYTLPSRYAEADELLGFAWETFAKLPAGWERAQGICDWVHGHIAYRRGISRPDWSATDVLARRQGVCRDRAHLVVALCRAFNMPARYAVAYLPDIEVADDGAPMDFHAYAEVWLEGAWYVFDPHQDTRRKGRVFIAAGLDAADAAFATLYGGATLNKFQVFADPIAESGETLDLSLPVRPAGATATAAVAVAVAAADAAPAASGPPLTLTLNRQTSESPWVAGTVALA